MKQKEGKADLGTVELNDIFIEAYAEKIRSLCGGGYMYILSTPTTEERKIEQIKDTPLWKKLEGIE